MVPMPSPPASDLVRRHRLFGWWSLLLFAGLGVGLETLHGFKVSWYLDAGEETRRLLWRLAHAHGAFLALVHLGFAASVGRAEGGGRRWPRLASACLVGASIALPGGFFAGGLTTYGGDPGPGIVVLPVGAALLLAGLALTAWGTTRSPRREPPG